MRHVFSCFFLTLAASFPGLAAIDTGLLALVPKDARLISSIDINQARNSQFGQYVLSKINNEDQSFKDMVDQTGFDPRRDLHDFVFATPGPSAAGATSSFALLVRGTFDESRIRAAARHNGSTIKNFAGIDLFLGPHNPDNAFVFLNSGVAVMGDVATVEQILSNTAVGTGLDPALQTLVATVGANNDAWFASIMPGSYLANHVKQETNQPAAGQALNAIVQSTGGIRFGDSVRLSFDAVARSAKDAQSLADVIRFLGSMVQLGREKAAGADILASAIDQMTLETNGNNLHVTLSLPEKSLEQLADMGPAMAPRRHLMH